MSFEFGEGRRLARIRSAASAASLEGPAQLRGVLGLVVEDVARRRANLAILQPPEGLVPDSPAANRWRAIIVVAAQVLDCDKQRRSDIQAKSELTNNRLAEALGYLRAYNLIEGIRPNDPRSEANYYYFAPTDDLRAAVLTAEVPALNEALQLVQSGRLPASDGS